MNSRKDQGEFSQPIIFMFGIFLHLLQFPLKSGIQTKLKELFLEVQFYSVQVFRTILSIECNFHHVNFDVSSNKILHV